MKNQGLKAAKHWSVITMTGLIYVITVPLLTRVTSLQFNSYSSACSITQHVQDYMKHNNVICIWKMYEV